MTGICTTVLCVCAQLCLTLCDPMDCVPMDCQASVSMGCFRKEYGSGLLFSTLGDRPNPGTEPGLQASSLPFEPPGKWEGAC